jgi:ribosome-associated protein
MSEVVVKNGVVIPEDELTVSASRAGGPGGQHVNKADTRITVRWNIHSTHALNEWQKERVLKVLEAQLTRDGDLVIHNSSSRSQQQNKKAAFEVLAEKVRRALYVPKRRMRTRVPLHGKEARLKEKAHRAEIKKGRGKKSFDV